MIQGIGSGQRQGFGEGRGPFLILFDLDGTLVDSHGYIVSTMQQAFSICDFDVPTCDEVRDVIGLSLNKAVDRLMGGLQGGHTRKVCDTYRELYARNRSRNTEPLFPGVKTALTRLFNQGYSLGIVTGKSTRGLMHMFKQHDLSKMFPVWRSADMCPSKPHPAMVLECMDETGIPPERTLVVGDSSMDMEMAVAGGVAAVGVSYGAQLPECLLAKGATVVIDHLSDLQKFLPSVDGDGVARRLHGGSHHGSDT
jgi:phosphoglycolate phosphatase